MELQQHGGTVAEAHLARSSRHDVPTSEVGLAGTQLSSSIYGTVIFDLTLFNEVTKSDNLLKNIEANVIDSCIEVIIGMPDIRSHQSNTLCSVAGRPNTPQCRDTFPHRMFTDDELIKKKDIFEPIEDDDDIDWKYNPFDVDSVEGSEEDHEQLLSKITFEGSPQFQAKLKALVLEFIDVFATKVRREPAAVEPMKIVIDEDKWRLPCNRAPPRCCK